MPPSLPVTEVLPALRAALAAHPVVLLEAPPGAGKSTLAPPALLDEPWLAGRKIIMLEPRRLATRAVARRMAFLRREEVGATVGFRTRLDRAVSSKTRLEVVTEGIIIRRLQSEPDLADTGLVILDEFHERHVETDLALAFLLDVQRTLRPDLKLLIMSATLERERLAELLGRPPIVACSGRLHPVEIIHSGVDARPPLANAVAAQVKQVLLDTKGDILVFLPGGGEIRRVQELLAAEAGDRLALLPLFGDLPAAAQDQALLPDARGRRKVILATPIAETSLTIEGVSAVVDSGWRREPRYSPATGMSSLETVRISRASAEQRAGRAGRLGPGRAYRLWSETKHRELRPHAAPEILGTDPAPLLLELAAWGAADPTTLTWLDPPPASLLAQAAGLLRELEALSSEGRITPHGRRLVALPAHPRLGHMLLLAAELGALETASDIAAILAERDPLRAGERSTVDLNDRLARLAAERRKGRLSGSWSSIDRAAKQLRSLVKPRGEPTILDPGFLLALAYPDRIAVAREKRDGRYLLANGRGARLDPGDPLCREQLIVAAVVDDLGREGKIHLAAPADEADLRRLMPQLFSMREIVAWEAREERVVSRSEERLGEILLNEKPLAAAPAEKLRAAMLEGVRTLGLGVLPWTEAAREWQSRVESLRLWLPEEKWPEVNDAWLVAHLEEWLEPHLDGVMSRAALGKLDLVALLESYFDRHSRESGNPVHGRRQRLEQDAPTHLTVPSGSRKRLAYQPGQPPVLAVKLQELFGLGETPRVARGRVPVRLHLLSPAGRPVQVTADLRNFWEKIYPEVRKELRGRYPKHPWPDDPWTATPTKRTKKRADG